jgi:large subunit ribosomal protein L23
MADLKYYDVLLRPLVTEKAMRELERGKYMMFVHPQATRSQVKEAVEKMFDGVKVAKVNTLMTNPKKRHRRNARGKQGYKPGQTVRRKKAIVTLAPGSNDIDFFTGM